VLCVAADAASAARARPVARLVCCHRALELVDEVLALVSNSSSHLPRIYCRQGGVADAGRVFTLYYTMAVAAGADKDDGPERHVGA